MSQEIVNECDYINLAWLTILRMIALQPCRMCWKIITGEYSPHWFRAGVFHSGSFVYSSRKKGQSWRRRGTATRIGDFQFDKRTTIVVRSYRTIGLSLDSRYNFERNFRQKSWLLSASWEHVTGMPSRFRVAVSQRRTKGPTSPTRRQVLFTHCSTFARASTITEAGKYISCSRTRLFRRVFPYVQRRFDTSAQGMMVQIWICLISDAAVTASRALERMCYYPSSEERRPFRSYSSLPTSILLFEYAFLAYQRTFHTLRVSIFTLGRRILGKLDGCNSPEVVKCDISLRCVLIGLDLLRFCNGAL